MLINNMHIGTVDPNNVLSWSKILVRHKLYIFPNLYDYSNTIWYLHKMIGEISNQLTLVSLQETRCIVDTPQDCKFSDRNYYSSVLSTSRLISLRRWNGSVNGGLYCNHIKGEKCNWNFKCVHKAPWNRLFWHVINNSVMNVLWQWNPNRTYLCNFHWSSLFHLELSIIFQSFP